MSRKELEDFLKSEHFNKENDYLSQNKAAVPYHLPLEYYSMPYGYPDYGNKDFSSRENYVSIEIVKVTLKK